MAISRAEAAEDLRADAARMAALSLVDADRERSVALSLIAITGLLERIATSLDTHVHVQADVAGYHLPDESELKSEHGHPDTCGCS